MKARGGEVRARPARGFTAIEVLLAMMVLLISTAGVLSMQKAAILGNTDARKLDVANSIARTWLDRLSTDATTWNSKTPTLAATQWLNTLSGGSGTFMVPAFGNTGAGSPTLLSPMFDIFGRDVLATGSAVFCTEVKVDSMALDSSANPTVLRATVLVFWPKSLLGGGAPTSPLCTQNTTPTDAATYEAAHPGTYHLLFATEMLRRAQ